MAFPIVPAFPVGISTPNVWVITIAAGATGVDMTTVTAVAFGVVRLGDLSQDTWHPTILGGATTSSLNVQLAFTGAEITTLGVYEISVTLTVPGGLVPCQAIRLDAVDAHVLPQTGTAPTSTTTITPIAGIPGLSGLAAHAVLLGTATGAVSAVGPGAVGLPLLGAGATTDPAFGVLLAVGGGVGDPWTDVAAGSTVTASFSQPNLSCDTSAAQTAITLPTAAQMASADGFVFTVKCTGNMLSPVIVNAGAGTTVELANAPGTFGASTWLPIQGQAMFFKYDKATTRWKAWAIAGGSGAPGFPAYNPGWYAQAAINIDPQGNNPVSKDSNAGTPAFPLRTYQEAVRRWGSTAPALTSLALTFTSSHVDDTDPVVFTPYYSGTVQVQGAAPAVVAAGVVLAGTTAKSRAAGTNRSLVTTLSALATLGMMVQNTSVGKASRAFTKISLGGNSFEMTQPVQLFQVPYAIPNEDPGGAWANGDTVSLLTPIAINLAMLAGTPTASTSNLFLQQCAIFSPTGVALDVCQLGNNVIVQDVISQRLLEVANDNASNDVLSNVLLAGGLSQTTGITTIVAGGCLALGSVQFGACQVFIDGDWCGESGFFQATGTNLFLGFVWMGSSFAYLDSQITFGTQFYGGHVIYGRAAQTQTFGGICQGLNASGTWVAGVTYATAIAGTGLILNAAATGSTHTGATPDVLTSGVATTVAAADAATGGLMFNLGGASLRKVA